MLVLLSWSTYIALAMQKSIVFCFCKDTSVRRTNIMFTNNVGVDLFLDVNVFERDEGIELMSGVNSYMII